MHCCTVAGQELDEFGKVPHAKRHKHTEHVLVSPHDAEVARFRNVVHVSEPRARPDAPHRTPNNPASDESSRLHVHNDCATRSPAHSERADGPLPVGYHFGDSIDRVR